MDTEIFAGYRILIRCGGIMFTLITLRRVRHTQLSSIGVERCNWQPWPSHASEP